MFGQIQQEIERGTSAAAHGVVELAPPQRDGAEEGVDGNGAVFVDRFADKRRGVIGEELAVVEEFFDDAPGIASKGVAQIGLK